MKINKKLTLLSVVVATMICGTANAAPQTVSGGKVTFNGEVTSGACSIKAGDANKIVPMDTVKASTFTAADQLAKVNEPFTIGLVDCSTDTLKTVQISFSGQTVSGKPGVLANNAGAGSAKNVGLQIFNPDGTALDIGKLSTEITLTENTNIPLSVDYISLDKDVTAGKVQSVADFMLTYN